MLHRWRVLVVLVAVVLGVCDSVPAVDSTFSLETDLKSHRKEAPRGGGPLDKVQLSVWIPGDTKVVKGAVFNPFNLSASEQQHWHAAARHWDFAVIGANYFGVKKEEFASTFDAAMQQLAGKASRPELAHLPLCCVGMSAGAGMSIQFAEQMPDRIIAIAPVCLEVGPKSPSLRTVPTVTIFGEKDGRQMPLLLEELPKSRKGLAQWAIAVQWQQRHEFARANNLAMPWFDRVIALRYPPDQTPVSGPVKLLSIDQEAGWLGDVSAWDQGAAMISHANKYTREPAEACWFPDAYTAHAWQAFVSKPVSLTIKRPAGLGDGQPFAELPAAQPLEVAYQVTDSAESLTSLALWDGDRMLGKLSVDDDQAKLPPLSPGIHVLILKGDRKDGTITISRPNVVIVGK